MFQKDAIADLYSRPHYWPSVVRFLSVAVCFGHNQLTLRYESFGFAIYKVYVITEYLSHKESSAVICKIQS